MDASSGPMCSRSMKMGNGNVIFQHCEPSAKKEPRVDEALNPLGDNWFLIVVEANDLTVCLFSPLEGKTTDQTGNGFAKYFTFSIYLRNLF